MFFMIGLHNDVNEHARMHNARNTQDQVVSENRQIGGGWAGALTCSCNASSAGSAGSPLALYGGTTTSGNIATTKLRHLNAHTTELLSSLGGQHGISALSAIDMSGDFVETTGAVVTGTMAREMATKAAKMVRAKAINELSGDKD
jgi:hypothetical protein